MNQNINPKSLKGKEVFNRTLDLMNKLTPINESVVNYSLEFVKRAPNGLVYTIIRENHKYFIKTTESTEFKLSELEYIGGLQNKMSESYSSYEQALKHLNMKFQQLNELYDIKGGYNLFEQDEVDAEEIDTDQEGIRDKKYKLKLSAGDSEPSADAPAPEGDEMPIPDFGGGEMESPEISDAPEGGEEGGGEGAMPEMPEGGEGEEGEEMSDMGAEEDEEDIDIDEEEDPKKYIQKLTGRLGQKLRELSEVDPKLEKYVINSIISALHVDKMDKKDRIDIMKKFKKKKGMESVMNESYNRQSVIDHYASVISEMSMDEEEAYDYLEDQGLDRQIINKVLEYVFDVDNDGLDEYYGGMKLKGPYNFEKLKSRSSDENGMMRKSMKHKPMRFKKHELDMDSDEQWQIPLATAVGSAVGSYFADKDESMDEELHGGQHKLDLNKNKRLDREDFRMLRSKKKRSSDESEDDSKSMDHKKRLADALKRIREKRRKSADERFDDMKFRSVSGGRDGGDTETMDPDIEIDEPLTPPKPKYPDPFNPEVPDAYPQPKAEKERELTFESLIKKYRVKK